MSQFVLMQMLKHALIKPLVHKCSLTQVSVSAFCGINPGNLSFVQTNWVKNAIISLAHCISMKKRY